MWDLKLSPRRERNIARRLKVWRVFYKMSKVCPWINWPILSYIYGFWYNIFDEGIRSTCKPRWGAVTFGWLNDGMEPTVWHTWRQLTHDQSDPYTGIYPSGAPKSFAQAKAWEDEWEAKRWEEYRERVWKEEW